MDDLAAAVNTYRRAVVRADAARRSLHRVIVAQLAAGTTQADIARATGYTRERVRQITRAAESD